MKRQVAPEWAEKRGPPSTLEEVREGRLKRSLVSLLNTSCLALTLSVTSRLDAELTSPEMAAAPHETGATRACLYVPGLSVPAQMPAEVARQAPMERAQIVKTPTPTATSSEKRELQERVLDGLANAVRDHYVVASVWGRDWQGAAARYRSLARQGLSDSDFYDAMQALVRELGDKHSYFQSPSRIQQDREAIAGRNDFVGVGALFSPVAGTEQAVVMSVFPASPASEAGLRPHDLLQYVDGGRIRESSGISRTLGPAGTTTTLTVQRPGESPREVRVTRRRVSGALPIDFCLVPGARIGYVFLPTLMDETMDDQLREALRRMTVEGPLRGLILDNRLNGGGLGSVTQAILSLFVGGLQGHFVSRAKREPLQLVAEDIGGSQNVPLIVLVDADTVSYGEVMSGVLQLSGRARLVGGRTSGNVEQLRRFDFADGSRAWLAAATFEPLGRAAGSWEETGIVPDVLLPTRWDLFTEATDPALAKAVELLLAK